MRKIIEELGFRPTVAVWELTLACNMRCGHCGSRAGRSDEMSDEELLRVARELSALGCKRVTLSGGEPTLRKAWPEIARTLIAGGTRVNMVTNGWAWTPETAHLVKEIGFANISFSLDGLEKTHDEIRRPGSFKRVLEAFEYCRSETVQLVSIMTDRHR